MDDNPYINKVGDKSKITGIGMKFLDSIVTDSIGPVYAFTKNANPVLVAAAMARLSRRGSDLREIFLDEFANVSDEKAEAVIKRVVTGYGDDSVQQLINVQLVVENASNLLTKQLEWGRFAGYLEQSTRYIYFDQQDRNGNYKYFTPKNLQAETVKNYKNTMNLIFPT
jgi:thymidylate synthase ThyX